MKREKSSAAWNPVHPKKKKMVRELVVHLYIGPGVYLLWPSWQSAKHQCVSNRELKASQFSRYKRLNSQTCRRLCFERHRVHARRDVQSTRLSVERTRLVLSASDSLSVFFTVFSFIPIYYQLATEVVELRRTSLLNWVKSNQLWLFTDYNDVVGKQSALLWGFLGAFV